MTEDIEVEKTTGFCGECDRETTWIALYRTKYLVGGTVIVGWKCLGCGAER
jgi:hypothetical protein